MFIIFNISSPIFNSINNKLGSISAVFTSIQYFSLTSQISLFLSLLKRLSIIFNQYSIYRNLSFSSLSHFYFHKITQQNIKFYEHSNFTFLYYSRGKSRLNFKLPVITLYYFLIVCIKMEESLILNNQNQTKKLNIFDMMIAELQLWRRRQFSQVQYVETLVQQIVFGNADHGAKILQRIREYVQGKDKKDFGSASNIFDIIKRKLQMAALQVKNQMLAIITEIPSLRRSKNYTHQETMNFIYLAWLKIRSNKISRTSIIISEQGNTIMEQFIKEIDQVGQKIYKFWLVLYENAEDKNISQIDMSHFIKQFTQAIFADKNKPQEDDIQTKTRSQSSEDKCCIICGVFHTNQNSLHFSQPSQNYDHSDEILVSKQISITINQDEQIQNVQKQAVVSSQKEELYVQKCCLQKNFEDLKQDQQLLLREVDLMIKEKQKEIEKQECWRSIIKECKDKCKMSRQKKCNCYQRKISTCKRYLEKLKKQRERLCLIENKQYSLAIKVEIDTKDNSQDDIKIKQQNEKNAKQGEPSPLKNKKKSKKQGSKKQQTQRSKEGKHQNVSSHKVLIKDEQQSNIYAYLTSMRLDDSYRSCCRVEENTLQKWKMMGQMYRKKDNKQVEKPQTIPRILEQNQRGYVRISKN